MALIITCPPNPFNMDEYKIDDKVEVNAVKGTICHISHSLDKYHVRTERNGVILVDAKDIKKLPKYAVGDLVRAGLKIFEVTEYNAYEQLYYFGDGEPRLNENSLEPFTGYRIGDTVWTVKRGKGKITDTSNFTAADRPFRAQFEKSIGFFSPKLSNLIPTERRYKKAIGEPTPAFNHLMDAYRYATTVLDWYTVPRTSSWLIDELNSYRWPMPKFRKGDVVFYVSDHILHAGMKKWTIDEVKNSSYIIRCGYWTINAVHESLLRLWKDTKFTHIVRADGLDMVVGSTDCLKTKHFKSVTYLGKNFKGLDTFNCVAFDGCICIVYGEKGDDC